MNKPIQHAWCEHKSNPERYSGLAELYDEFRPGYPKAIIDELMRIADLKIRDSVVISVNGLVG